MVWMQKAPERGRKRENTILEVALNLDEGDLDTLAPIRKLDHRGDHATEWLVDSDVLKERSTVRPS
jgi:hypothetical protein